MVISFVVVTIMFVAVDIIPIVLMIIQTAQYVIMFAVTLFDYY